MSHLPVLLVVVPLLSAFAAHLAGLWLGQRAAYPLAQAALTAEVAIALGAAQQAIEHGAVHYHVSGWPMPLGIELIVDGLSALMTVLIAVLAWVSLLHSAPLVEKEIGHKAPQFYALALLLVTSLMGISLTGDAFNLYVMLEISSLSTYGLIALGGGRAYLATFHYIIMGTIGASFYLLGVGYLYIKTGSLNMADLHQILKTLPASDSVLVGFGLMLVGALLKMALFPLHAWLPNAYTYAPNATSSLVGPLSTKVSVYIMIRMMLSIFGHQFTARWAGLLVFLASVGIVGGSLMALSKRDLKKAFSCIIVAEAGYMAGGVWLGNTLGLTGAIFHLVNDAMVTLALFMITGNIIYRLEVRNFDQVGQLFRRMPVTATVLLICAMGVVGVPPTSGFISKFYLVSGAIQAGHPEFAIALLTASLCNAALFLRIFESCLYAPDGEKRGEAPWSMSLTLAGVGVALLALGIFSNAVITHFVLPVVPG
ncbi:MAG: complex I subunit 5 family protein [Vulcanimicrobiota bacterium]